MSHDHNHAGAAGGGSQQRLALVLGLSLAYMAAEVVGGLLTNSLALLADAAHMFTDVAALALALFAIRVARRPPGGRQTYGYYRAEVLAALVNAATLVGVSVYIFVEAYHRFQQPPPVLGGMMAAIALGGLVVNLVGMRILAGGRQASLNVRSAWLHVVTDALGSLGAVVGGLLVWGPGWHLADPVVSVFIGVLVLYSSWGLLQETVSVLMESAPGHLDVDEVRAALLSVGGVSAIHDLHVWTITSGKVAASVHVVPDGSRDAQVVLDAVTAVFRERFAIDHVTIQVDGRGDDICRQGSEPTA